MITRKPYFIFSHLDRLLLSCVFSTCWWKESFCSFFPLNLFICNSPVWAARSPGLMEGFKDGPTQGKPRSRDWAKMRAWFEGWQKRRRRRSEKLINSPLLFSCHRFSILLFRNSNIPAVKSHCWIQFLTSLCYEHIETNTHGDCYPFKRPCNPTSFPLGLFFLFFLPWP